MTMSMESHAPDELLERYAMRSLTEGEAEELEDHLMFCRQCQLQLESIENFLFAARQASRQVLTQEPKESSFWSKFGLFRLRSLMESPRHLAFPAAGLAMALSALFLLMPAGQVPYQQVRLEAMRGSESMTATPKAPVELTLNIDGLAASPDYLVEVVQANGSKIFSAPSQAQSGSLTVRVPSKLSSGQYWVRVYLPGSTDPAREFALRVQ